MFSFPLISEQGRRNDIKTINSILHDSIVPPTLDVICKNVHCKMISEQGQQDDISSIMMALDDLQIVTPLPHDVSSDSVHCNALTQPSAASHAFSCHTTDFCCEDNDVVDSSLAIPKQHPKCPYPSGLLSQGTHIPPQPSWVHVYSKTCSTTSLCTQSAAVAYLDVKSSKVLHRRMRRAKKKELNLKKCYVKSLSSR